VFSAIEQPFKTAACICRVSWEPMDNPLALYLTGRCKHKDINVSFTASNLRDDRSVNCPCLHHITDSASSTGQWQTGNIQAHMVSSCSNSTSLNSVTVFRFFHEWVHIPQQLSSFLELITKQYIVCTSFFWVSGRPYQCSVCCSVAWRLTLTCLMRSLYFFCIFYTFNSAVVGSLSIY